MVVQHYSHIKGFLIVEQNGCLMSLDDQKGKITCSILQVTNQFIFAAVIVYNIPTPRYSIIHYTIWDWSVNYHLGFRLQFWNRPKTFPGWLDNS